MKVTFMSLSTYNHASFLLITNAFFVALMALAGDAEITTDFERLPNMTAVDASFFTHTAMCVLIGAERPMVFNVLKASVVEFPALIDQSVSYAVLQYPAGSVDAPHSHPCSSELLFHFTGSLEVGFVDTSNKIYVQTLKAGDMFIFPKGLVHYQYNNGQDPAFALSAFGSATPGTVLTPIAVFATAITDDIVAKSFKIDVSTAVQIRSGLTPKAYWRASCCLSSLNAGE